MKLKGRIADKRKMEVDLNLSFSDIKMLAEDDNGYMYTSQSKGSDGKLIGAITSHFTYLKEDKKEGYISIQDEPALASVDDQAALYSEANTRKIREIIAKSVMFK